MQMYLRLDCAMLPTSTNSSIYLQLAIYRYSVSTMVSIPISEDRYSAGSLKVLQLVIWLCLLLRIRGRFQLRRCKLCFVYLTIPCRTLLVSFSGAKTVNCGSMMKHHWLVPNADGRCSASFAYRTYDIFEGLRLDLSRHHQV
jgi:hypothetical protein